MFWAETPGDDGDQDMQTWNLPATPAWENIIQENIKDSNHINIIK